MAKFGSMVHYVVNERLDVFTKRMELIGIGAFMLPPWRDQGRAGQGWTDLGCGGTFGTANNAQ